METRGSWHAWTEREWQDEVAPMDEELGRFDQDIEAFLRDMGDMAKTVVECTWEPLRAFAEGFPRTMAFESKHWRRGRRHDWRRWSHS